MAELKTKPTDENVAEFLNTIADESKCKDAFTILNIMRQVTGTEPKMWGSNIVGFGHRHYHYASGREGDWFLVGFSPRKQNLTLYLSYGDIQKFDLLQKLGKYKTGKGCLYIKNLGDVDLSVLKEIISRAVIQLSAG